MNILLAWLITSAEFLLIDTASILRIFKDLADQGFKINYEKFNENTSFFFKIEKSMI